MFYCPFHVMSLTLVYPPNQCFNIKECSVEVMAVRRQRAESPPGLAQVVYKAEFCMPCCLKQVTDLP